MKTTILLFGLFLLLQTGCNKEDVFKPTLPPITQTGENTFGCFIDGNLLTPRSGTGWQGIPDPGMIFLGTTSMIYNELRVRDFKSGNFGILKLHIDNLDINGEGSFIINESNCEDGNNANPNINITCRLFDNWYCSIENGGTLIITRYDFDNGIVSGTFSCTAVNKDDPNDVIEITEGRFDINWGKLTAYTEFP